MEINFDMLFGRDDDPPPELTITDAAGKPISPEDAEEADQHSVKRMKNYSDKELIDKISKWRIFLQNCSLVDGGHKLRISLKNAEAELTRRKLQKVGDLLSFY